MSVPLDPSVPSRSVVYDLYSQTVRRIGQGDGEVVASRVAYRAGERLPADVPQLPLDGARHAPRRAVAPQFRGEHRSALHRIEQLAQQCRQAFFLGQFGPQIEDVVADVGHDRAQAITYGIQSGLQL